MNHTKSFTVLIWISACDFIALSSPSFPPALSSVSTSVIDRLIFRFPLKLQLRCDSQTCHSRGPTQKAIRVISILVPRERGSERFWPKDTLYSLVKITFLLETNYTHENRNQQIYFIWWQIVKMRQMKRIKHTYNVSPVGVTFFQNSFIFPTKISKNYKRKNTFFLSWLR